MGYVPQEISLYEDMTLELYLRYIAELKCIEYAAIADEIVRVTVLLGLEHAGKRPLRELSEGQQRRAMIAQALLGRPSFLIMDEPYVGLDLEQRRSIHCFLQEYAEHAVVVVATHFIEEFRDGDYDQILVLPNNS
jgi:ABC-type multidrug transport system ATPase subunit